MFYKKAQLKINSMNDAKYQLQKSKFPAHIFYCVQKLIHRQKQVKYHATYTPSYLLTACKQAMQKDGNASLKYYTHREIQYCGRQLNHNK